MTHLLIIFYIVNPSSIMMTVAPDMHPMLSGSKNCLNLMTSITGNLAICMQIHDALKFMHPMLSGSKNCLNLMITGNLAINSQRTEGTVNYLPAPVLFLSLAPFRDSVQAVHLADWSAIFARITLVMNF